MTERNRLYAVALFTLLILYSGCDRTRVIKIQNGVQLQTSKWNVKAQFHADSIVRIVKWPPGAECPTQRVLS